jgi:Fungal protein kinase
MAFCYQPERDFLPFICITRNHFYITVTDHAGQIETNPIPFDRTSSTLIFFRLVMGLAFLPISNLGLDPTIIRLDQGKKGVTFLNTLEKSVDSFPIPLPLPLLHLNLTSMVMWVMDSSAFRSTMRHTELFGFSFDPKPWLAVRRKLFL